MTNRITHHTAPDYMPRDIPVIYHDDYLVAIEKPSGLLSVKGIGIDKIDCVAVRVSSAIEGARIVHRLDRDTSGIMVMARDAETHRQLSRQFQDREVLKQYVAIVGGILKADTGTIDIPIRKDIEDPPRQCVDLERGKPSLTDWHVMQRGDNQTRLKLIPRTGRSHQLRIHLRELGHPILGDDLYASPDYLAMSSRLKLHATLLEITHPATKNRLTFKSECPF